MSRREEVKAEIGEWGIDGDSLVQMALLRNRCRTLADEVDAITAERDEWKRKYDEVNENYMGLVNLFLPYLQAAQERAIAEGKS